MTGMFCKAKSFNQPLDNWDTKNVNEYLGLTDMFKTAKILTIKFHLLKILSLNTLMINVFIRFIS